MTDLERILDRESVVPLVTDGISLRNGRANSTTISYPVISYIRRKMLQFSEGDPLLPRNGWR